MCRSGTDLPLVIGTVGIALGQIPVEQGQSRDHHCLLFIFPKPRDPLPVCLPAAFSVGCSQVSTVCAVLLAWFIVSVPVWCCSVCRFCCSPNITTLLYITVSTSFCVSSLPLRVISHLLQVTAITCADHRGLRS